MSPRLESRNSLRLLPFTKARRSLRGTIYHSLDLLNGGNCSASATLNGLPGHSRSASTGKQPHSWLHAAASRRNRSRHACLGIPRLMVDLVTLLTLSQRTSAGPVLVYTVHTHRLDFMACKSSQLAGFQQTARYKLLYKVWISKINRALPFQRAKEWNARSSTSA